MHRQQWLPHHPLSSSIPYLPFESLSTELAQPRVFESQATLHARVPGPQLLIWLPPHKQLACSGRDSMCKSARSHWLAPASLVSYLHVRPKIHQNSDRTCVEVQFLLEVHPMHHLTSLGSPVASLSASGWMFVPRWYHEGWLVYIWQKTES